MTSIPLSAVVAFLRPRGALGVLDGAPFFYAHEADAPHLRSVNLRELTQIGDVKRVATVMLYLGDGEICPAAEGWAIRVLLIALGVVPEVVKQGGLFGVATEGVAFYWPSGEDRLARQVWSWCPVQVAGWRQMYEPLIMPLTPAARLAAVLRYEMERAK